MRRARYETGTIQRGVVLSTYLLLMDIIQCCFSSFLSLFFKPTPFHSEGSNKLVRFASLNINTAHNARNSRTYRNSKSAINGSAGTSHQRRAENVCGYIVLVSEEARTKSLP